MNTILPLIIVKFASDEMEAGYIAWRDARNARASVDDHHRQAAQTRQSVTETENMHKESIRGGTRY